MLADFEIIKALQDEWIGVEPFDPVRVQPVSLDLTLSKDIRVPAGHVFSIDPKMDADDNTSYYGEVPSWHTHTDPRTISPEGFRLRPRGFLLACTEEVITLSPHMAARVEGKSSLGRLGLAVHITAGFIDPGFSGQITLEIANLAPWSIKLYTGMPIAQIVFEPVSAPEKDYSTTGHYQGQRGPTESVYRLR